MSAIVRSSDAEMLKSSFAAAALSMAVTMPSAMSSTCVSVRVCSPDPKISSGCCPESALRMRSGTAWAIPGSSSGSSPGPYALKGRQIVYGSSCSSWSARQYISPASFEKP